MKREKREWLTRTDLKVFTLSPTVVLRVGCPADKVARSCDAAAYRRVIVEG
jgi:hypothetical protein